MAIGPEESISIACSDWIEYQKVKDERYGLVFSVQNERKVNKFAGGRWNRRGRKKGVSDWIILCPSKTGRYHGAALELKAGKNDTTPEQAYFLALADKHGNFATVIKSVDAFISVVTKYFEEW